MKLSKPIGLTEFNSLKETKTGVTRPSIITELIGSLGSREAGIFTLTYGEFMGVRRAFAHWKRNKTPAKLEMKLLKATGTGSGKSYEVAIKRLGSD